jgi:murein L,D-transpeptidase YcbB/YkuD
MPPKSLVLLFFIVLFATAASSIHASPAHSVPGQCEAIKDHGSQASDSLVAVQLCSLIEDRVLNELRRPDCSSLDTEIRQFYRSWQYLPGWIQNGRPTEQANTMIALFRGAERKGLESEDYDASLWSARLQALSSDPTNNEALARFDVAVTVASLRYLSDLYQGRVTPKECEVDLPGKHFDGAQFLREEVTHASDIRTAVGKVEPPFDGYQRTLAALEHYVALAREGDGTALPPMPKPLHAGDLYDGAPQLAERLRQLGDLSTDATEPASRKYQGPLVTAVRAFQRRHGLQADDVLSPATFEELNVPLSQRVAQIKLVLERWRWLPHDLGPRVLVVNIPEYRLRGYDHHRLTLTMRAIVGQAIEHQTPVFADSMQSVVFRPYWSVPESIQKDELVPLLRRNRAYLVKNNMEVVNGRGETVAASKIDAKMLDQLAAGRLHLRQQPGPANSLGLIKFVFPNKFDVYMHGTPLRGLFSQARRDFSHGCIRVENPAALAGWVLRDSPEWTPQRILATMQGKNAVSVQLRTPIPVLILYGTVFVEENGAVYFFKDIYGNDAALEKVLSASRR